MIQIEAARQLATKRHVKRGKVEIDPNCPTTIVPTGVWVEAWVFVSNADIDAARAAQ